MRRPTKKEKSVEQLNLFLGLKDLNDPKKKNPPACYVLYIFRNRIASETRYTHEIPFAFFRQTNHAYLMVVFYYAQINYVVHN